MLRAPLLSTTALTLMLALSPAPSVADGNGAQKVTATLAGHAVIPAATFVPAPADAPAALSISGRFTGPGNRREEQLYAIEGRTWIGPKDAEKRATGLSLPFVGQPVQGFSGVSHLGEGVYLALSDNGFGSKVNSQDAMLMAHRLEPDWETGKVAILETIFLSDPDRVLPFSIQNEHTETRYLTGADFDIEAIQLIDGLMWFGDEFGPFLFATDTSGKVVYFTETTLDGRTLHSPDHFGIRAPSWPGEVSFETRRSRGYEGMAKSPDGSLLYPLLEGPVWDAEAGAPESVGGREVLRLMEFNVADRAWTGRSWLYPLEANGHAIGDFNMISETRGLVIERDGNEGDAALACPADNLDGPDCFARPAEFKRVYLIDMAGVAPGQSIKKLAYVDLLDIEDPDGLARLGGGDGKFTFPMVTIEDVDVVDAEHIIVGNDNNLPFSTGRAIGVPDDNEWILLHVPDLLQ
ncbi:MAG: esterase-like activity of phytase family protein [Pseudomonadota bacterium]